MKRIFKKEVLKELKHSYDPEYEGGEITEWRDTIPFEFCDENGNVPEFKWNDEEEEGRYFLNGKEQDEEWVPSEQLDFFKFPTKRDFLDDELYEYLNRNNEEEDDDE